MAAADEHAAATGGRRPLLEISGGITLETVTRYVGLGADMISVGGLTNSAPVLDIGLDIGPSTPSPNRQELTVLLAIDAGNTETVVGLYDLDGPDPTSAAGAEDGLIDHWRIATEADRTADELAVLLQGFLSLRGFGLDEVEGMAVSSGVPRVKESLRQLADRYLDFDPVMIEPGVRTGIAILAENPKEVGADRIANAVAAFDLFGGPTIVADFGTATTCDAVSANGRVPRRRHRPRHRHQHGRPGRAGGRRWARSSWSSRAACSARPRSSASSRAPSTASPPRSTACASASSASSASAPSSRPAAWPT